MAYDPEKLRARRQRDYMRKRGLYVPPARSGRPLSSRFVAIDGEGGNLPMTPAQWQRELDRVAAEHAKGHTGIKPKNPPTRHEYTLLVAAGNGVRRHLDNGGAPLRARQCLDFILSIPKRHTLISFYFNYDVTMMLRELDRETLLDLVDRDGRTDQETGKTRACHWQGYEIDWIFGKLFKVAKNGASRVVYDTAGFFQSSFTQALEGWRVGNEKEKAFIQTMKNERSEFTGEVTQELIDYSTTECELLCKLMDLVNQEARDQGFTLRTFSGAGSLANAMLEKWGVEKNIAPLPPPVENAAWHAYFGGRFEVAAIGEIPGPVYEYDINSAYPHAMQDLPCLAHGRWRHIGPAIKGTKIDDGDPEMFAVYHLKWYVRIGNGSVRQSNKSAQWGPLPWRSQDGGISFPLSGEGWYWGPEYEAAMRSRYAPYITQIERWVFTPECDHKPFQLIPHLYRHRKELKAQGHLGERVIKLGLNSLYGKTAQQVGTRKFASPAWAGWITSTCRAMVLDAMQTEQGWGNSITPNVLMSATDAVYSLVPLDSLDTGDGLGQWEMQEHDNMLIVAPGVYALNVDTDRAVIRKTRGIHKTEFNASDVLKVWREATNSYGETDGSGYLFTPRTSFIGLRRGLVSKMLEPGQWVDEYRLVRFMPTSKRDKDNLFKRPIVKRNPHIMWAGGFPLSDDITMSRRYESKTLDPAAIEAHMLAIDDYSTPGPESVPELFAGVARSDMPTEGAVYERLR